MKTWIVNLIAKLSGMGKLFDSINGYKTYAAAAVLILSGLAQLITEAIGIHDAAGLLEFVKQIATDPAIITIMQGLAAFGLRHSIEKAATQP